MEESISKAAEAVSEAVTDAVAETGAASGSSIWETLKAYLVEYGIRLLIALVVLFVGLKLIKFFTKRIKEKKSLKKLDTTASSLLGSFIGITCKVLLFVTVIAILGIPMTSVITILGTVSLAIGLALQGSLANFAGGLMIILFKPFKIGDFIDIRIV